MNIFLLKKLLKLKIAITLYIQFHLILYCFKKNFHFYRIFLTDILDKTEVSSESNKILLDSIYNYLASVHNKELIISGQDAIYLIKNFRKNFRYSEKHYNNNHG